MPGKHYAKLGRTKIIRVPEKSVEWVKEIVREIDTKEDVEDLMELRCFTLDLVKLTNGD